MSNLQNPSLPDPLPHSGVGIASVVIAGLALLCFAYQLADAAYLASPHRDLEAVVAYGIAFLATLVLSVIGLAVAIAGCLLPDRRLLFSKMGLGINFFILVAHILYSIAP